MKPSQDTSSDTFVTTRVAAKMLNVSLRTIQLWVESGVLSAWKTSGGHRKVSVKSVEMVLSQRQDALKNQESTSKSKHSAFEILLVEDDEGVRQLFNFYFTNWKRPVKLDVANNGFEGLIALGNKMPDLLVTDLNMPGINGFDLLRYLGNSPQFSKLDIVVITALPPEDFVNNVAITPNLKIFPKPINFDQFERYILPLIDKKLGA